MESAEELDSYVLLGGKHSFTWNNVSNNKNTFKLLPSTRYRISLENEPVIFE